MPTGLLGIEQLGRAEIEPGGLAGILSRDDARAAVDVAADQMAPELVADS